LIYKNWSKDILIFKEKGEKNTKIDYSRERERERERERDHYHVYIKKWIIQIMPPVIFQEITIINRLLLFWWHQTDRHKHY